MEQHLEATIVAPSSLSSFGPPRCSAYRRLRLRSASALVVFAQSAIASIAARPYLEGLACGLRRLSLSSSLLDLCQHGRESAILRILTCSLLSRPRFKNTMYSLARPPSQLFGYIHILDLLSPAVVSCVYSSSTFAHSCRRLQPFTWSYLRILCILDSSPLSGLPVLALRYASLEPVSVAMVLVLISSLGSQLASVRVVHLRCPPLIRGSLAYRILCILSSTPPRGLRPAIRSSRPNRPRTSCPLLESLTSRGFSAAPFVAASIVPIRPKIPGRVASAPAHTARYES